MSNTTPISYYYSNKGGCGYCTAFDVSCDRNCFAEEMTTQYNCTKEQLPELLTKLGCNVPCTNRNYYLELWKSHLCEYCPWYVSDCKCNKEQFESE